MRVRKRGVGVFSYHIEQEPKEGGEEIALSIGDFLPERGARGNSNLFIRFAPYDFEKAERALRKAFREDLCSGGFAVLRGVAVLREEEEGRDEKPFLVLTYEVYGLPRDLGECLRKISNLVGAYLRGAFKLN